MPDQQPQDQPRPASDQTGRDWNEVSTAEIEQKLGDAADLAYELAGDIGVAGDQPRFRDTAELAAIENALDAELKQIDHLVGKARQELGEVPAATRSTEQTTPSIPDFMAEFMTDEPARLFPAALDSSSTAGAEQLDGVGASPEFTQAIEHEAIPGLVGIGSLGQRREKKSKADKVFATQRDSTPPTARPNWVRALESPIYKACQTIVFVLELVDRPLAKLSSTTRRALNVTALAAFCVCLLTFLLSFFF